MDIQKILTAEKLNLKPNGILDLNTGKSPYLYQRRAGLLMLLRSRMVLGDDVGLGKTLETILMMSYVKAARPETKFLIFTEKNALLQWLEELALWAPSLKVRILTADTHPDIKSRITAMRTHGMDVIITSYSMLNKYHSYLKEGMQPRWVFIADEPDIFKNTQTVAHTNGFDLVNGPGGACRAYGLTATIIGNRLSEAFGILRVVAPGTFSSELEFEKNFCIIRRRKGHRKIVGYKNLDQFRSKISPVFFGRLQDDPEVEQDLPDVITKDVPIQLSVKQSWKVVEAMDRILEMANGEVQQLAPLPAMTMAQILTDDPRVKDFDIKGSKTEALVETLQGSLKGERVVVYSKFRSVIDKIEEDLEKVKIPCVRITGKEKTSQRDEAKRRFMSDGEDHIPVLLMTKAGQRAMNLQKGGHLFFFDLPWAYDLYRQTIGRLKRTGSSHKKIGVYRYLAVLHPEVAKQVGTEKTIDHHTLSILMKKFELWKALTDDAKEIEGVNGNDVQEIFDLVVNSFKRAP